MSAGHIKGWGNWQEKLVDTERKEEKNWNRDKYGEMNTKRVEWFVLVALAGLFMVLVGMGMMQYVGRARRMAHVSNVNSIRTALQSSFTVHMDELEREWKTGDINFYISPTPEVIPDDTNGSILRQDIDELLVSCGVYQYWTDGLNEQLEELEGVLEAKASLDAKITGSGNGESGNAASDDGGPEDRVTESAAPNVAVSENKEKTDKEKKTETASASEEKTGWVYEVIQQSGTLTINYWSEYNNYEKKPEEPDCIFTVTGPADSCLAALAGSYR